MTNNNSPQQNRDYIHNRRYVIQKSGIINQLGRNNPSHIKNKLKNNIGSNDNCSRNIQLSSRCKMTMTETQGVNNGNKDIQFSVDERPYSGDVKNTPDHIAREQEDTEGNAHSDKKMKIGSSASSLKSSDKCSNSPVDSRYHSHHDLRYEPYKRKYEEVRTKNYLQEEHEDFYEAELEAIIPRG